MMKYDVGLVVGKFSPLHKGHELLINTAIQNCEKVLIISYTSRELGFSAQDRYSMLTAMFPTAMIVTPTGYPVDDAPDGLHREFCGIVAEEVGLIPDAVFTSEEYGDGFAHHLSQMFSKTVAHVEVDKARIQIPICGTALRKDKRLWAKFVDPIVERILK